MQSAPRIEACVSAAQLCYCTLAGCTAAAQAGLHTQYTALRETFAYVARNLPASEPANGSTAPLLLQQAPPAEWLPALLLPALQLDGALKGPGGLVASCCYPREHFARAVCVQAASALEALLQDVAVLQVISRELALRRNYVFSSARQLPRATAGTAAAPTLVSARAAGASDGTRRSPPPEAQKGVQQAWPNLDWSMPKGFVPEVNRVPRWGLTAASQLLLLLLPPPNCGQSLPLPL